jgi:signal peptidase I
MKRGIILGLSVIVLTCAVVHVLPIRFLTVSGHSMEPVITASDVIAVTTRVDLGELKIGDIVVYEYDTGDETISIAHRIIAIDENGVTTKGDSNYGTDSYVVKPSDITGNFKLKIPHIGSFIRFANTDRGYLSLILMPAMMLIIIEIRKIIKYTEEL